MKLALQFFLRKLCLVCFFLVLITSTNEKPLVETEYAGREKIERTKKKKRKIALSAITYFLLLE